MSHERVQLARSLLANYFFPYATKETLQIIFPRDQILGSKTPPALPLAVPPAGCAADGEDTQSAEPNGSSLSAEKA